MADNETLGGAIETRADAGKGESGRVSLWLDALSLAEKTEKAWRRRAQAAVQRYRDEEERTGVRFNILHANTETLGPALYNSTPVPDVRRRHGDRDQTGKLASQVIQRSLAASMDAYDFDASMQGAVFDSIMVGRGIVQVRYVPAFAEDGTVAYEEVVCEQRDWRDFLHGPGRRWSEVGWVAFRERITRDQAVEAFGAEIGGKVKLDWVQDGAETNAEDRGARVPDIFKRLTYWQIWDKEKREVVFVAPSWKEAPLKVISDPLGLRDFFPMPRPLYDVSDPNCLIPIVPYSRYEDQAKELDRITRRIHALVNVLRWRGVRDASLTEFDLLKDAEDGDLIASEGVVNWIDKGGLEKAVWLMPIERLITVVRELIVQREAIKQTIFELTGLSDIMRGQSEPDETLGAQRIKTQWGSLRLQRRQREVQRLARDVLRMKAEIMAEKFAPETLAAMSGTELPSAGQKAVMQSVAAQAQAAGQPVPPDLVKALSGPSWDDVVALLRNDVLRGFRIDVETDSTIQADLGYAQQNMTQFVQGIGSFFQAIGPAVASGSMPKSVAVKLLTAFARKFNLGRQAEDALDELGAESEQPQAPQPDPQAQAAQAQAQADQVKAQNEQAKLQMDGQKAQAEMGMKQQVVEAKVKLDQQRLALDRGQAQAEIGLRRAEVNSDIQIERERLELDRLDRTVRTK